MFGLPIIISILIIVAAFFIFLKIFKVIWKVILLTLLVIIIIIGVFAYIVYQDVNHIIHDEKLVLVTSNDEILTGAIITDNTDTIQYLTRTEIEQYEPLINEEKYEEVLGDKYLLITIETGVFDTLNNTIEFQGEEYEKQEVISMLAAETPNDFVRIASTVSKNISVEDTINDDEMIQYKAQISAALLQQTLEDYQNGEENLIENTEIYPETITIGILKGEPDLINAVL